MRELNYYEAKFEALDEIMAGDRRVHLINGTFLSLSPHRHVYQNLLQKYRERMISPPISELGFCGLATGAADTLNLALKYKANLLLNRYTDLRL